MNAAPSLQITPMLVAIGIAIAGPFIWVGLYVGLNNLWIAPLLIGLLMGIGLRATMKHGDRRLQIVASVLVVLSCIVGYLWIDMFVMKWIFNGTLVQPTVGDAAKRLLNNNLILIVLIAVGAYLAWVISVRTNPTNANDV